MKPKINRDSISKVEMTAVESTEQIITKTGVGQPWTVTRNIRGQLKNQKCSLNNHKIEIIILFELRNNKPFSVGFL